MQRFTRTHTIVGTSPAYNIVYVIYSHLIIFYHVKSLATTDLKYYLNVGVLCVTAVGKADAEIIIQRFQRFLC